MPVSFSLPTQPLAQGRSGLVDFCKQDVSQNPPFVVGDCVGFVNTFFNDSQGLVRFICDYLSVTDPDLFYASYEDVPECIRDKASELPPPPYYYITERRLPVRQPPTN